MGMRVFNHCLKVLLIGKVQRENYKKDTIFYIRHAYTVHLHFTGRRTEYGDNIKCYANSIRTAGRMGGGDLMILKQISIDNVIDRFRY